MSLALIYARSRNYCIGVDGALPWDLPDEFAHFTRTTLGTAVIMGRKTYQDHDCELPGRVNIVVTRNEAFPLPEGTLRAASLAHAINIARAEERPIFVVGGARLYREALPLADTVYETIVEAEVAGDVYIDAFDFTGWDSEVLMRHNADERHDHGFSVYRHRRMG